jgi:hypothetical protein
LPLKQQLFAPPGKRKTPEDIEPSAAEGGISHYKCQAWEHDFLDLESSEKIEKLIELALMLDVGLHFHSEQLDSVISSFKESNTFFSKAAGAIESRTDTLCDFVGDRPDQMAQAYKASSVWGTIAALATQLDKVTDLTKIEKLDHMMRSLIKPIDKKMENLIRGHSEIVSNDVNPVRIAVGHLVNEFQLNSTELNQGESIR